MKGSENVFRTENLKKKSFCIGNKLFATSSVEQARDRNKTLLNMRVMQVLGKIYEGDIS